MSLKDKLDKLFERVPASYFAILTGILCIATVGIATLLYYLGDNSFTFSSHWISHLGNGPNGSGIVYTIGFIFASILALPFLLYLYYLVKSEMEKHHILMYECLIASIITVIGLLINAIWNYKDDPYLHVTGSSTFFFGGLFMLLFYSIAMYLSPNISRLQSYIGFGVTGVFAAFLFTFLPFTMNPSIDLMQLLTTTDPRASILRILEWIVFFAVIFWFIELGLFTIKKEK